MAAVISVSDKKSCIPISGVESVDEFSWSGFVVHTHAHTDTHTSTNMSAYICEFIPPPPTPSCPASTTSMRALPSRPTRATHTGTAASPSRECHRGVQGRSTVRQALGPDNCDSPSPVVSAHRRVLTVGQGVQHRP